MRALVPRERPGESASAECRLDKRESHYTRFRSGILISILLVAEILRFDWIYFSMARMISRVHRLRGVRFSLMAVWCDNPAATPR